jgi:8-oxo-dGTP pyrophosphatase MutT (NUDIX family)
MADVERLGGRELVRTPWLSLRQDDVQFADGTRGTYSVVDKRDFAVVLPYTGDGFWLVQQYRYPLGRRSWEFPQGGWPPGRAGGTALELATTELAEETGLRADSLEHLGRLDASPGLATNAFDVFLATGLHDGAPQREASEADMVHAYVSVDELDRMMRAGEFRDSNSVAALALFWLCSHARS